MKKLFTCLLLLAVFSILGCSSDEKNTVNDDRRVLNLYSWADHFDPVLVEEFEQQYNCRVNYDTFGNNEELFAKIKAGGAQYDLILPSDYMVATMLKLDMLEEFNLDNIPNAQNLTPDLRYPSYDPSGKHSLVYTWGITGIIYNTRYIKEQPQHWADLWNPQYEGRLVLMNDCREVMGMALKKNGHSNNSTNPQEVREAFLDLKQLSPLVLAYDTDTIKQKFIADEGWIGTIWSGDASFVHKENKDIAFVIPEEGTVIWADTFAIPKGAKHKELAEQFINFFYGDEISARNYEYVGYSNPILTARPYQTQEFLNDPMLKIGEEGKHRGEWLTDIGAALPMYDRYWTEIKTGR